jgi:hypothetical protein
MELIFNSHQLHCIVTSTVDNPVSAVNHGELTETVHSLCTRRMGIDSNIQCNRRAPLLVGDCRSNRLQNEALNCVNVFAPVPVRLISPEMRSPIAVDIFRGFAVLPAFPVPI